MGESVVTENLPVIEANLQEAVETAIRHYLARRRDKVGPFVHQHFSVSGALRINRKALGTDLLKAPANMVWVLPYTAARMASGVCKKVGLKRIEKLCGKVPAGFRTAVQQEINRLIFAELLELPDQTSQEEEQKDALFAEILNQPAVQSLLDSQLAEIAEKAKGEGFRRNLEGRLEEYFAGRNATTEMAGNIIALATGAGALGKMTPGGLTLGALLASAIAQQSAISGFLFGPTLGGLYYGMFPASASLGLVAASTSGVLASLAVVSAFAGVVIDPVQARFGIHEKRLNQLIDSLEDTLLGKEESQLKVTEMYLARVFDLAELLKLAARTVG